MAFLSDPALLLDVLVAVLLVATIAYAAILNRKLSNLRANRAEMEQAINDLTQASMRAEQSMKALKLVAAEAEADLNAGLGKAQSLRDELSFLVERGDNVADRVSQKTAAPVPAKRPSGGPSGGGEDQMLPSRRLQASVESRQSGRNEARAEPRSEEPDDDLASVASKAERDLMRALKDQR